MAKQIPLLDAKMIEALVFLHKQRDSDSPISFTELAASMNISEREAHMYLRVFRRHQLIDDQHKIQEWLRSFVERCSKDGYSSVYFVANAQTLVSLLEKIIDIFRLVFTGLKNEKALAKKIQEALVNTQPDHFLNIERNLTSAKCMLTWETTVKASRIIWAIHEEQDSITIEQTGAQFTIAVSVEDSIMCGQLVDLAVETRGVPAEEVFSKPRTSH